VSPEGGVIGWDLGGAHLKLAWLDANGRLRRVAERATPLWQGLEPLGLALDELARTFPLDTGEHYLTMTGELVDLFEDRAQGVVGLADYMAQRLPAGRLHLYAGPLGFVEPSAAAHEHARIASANWYATAAWTAARVRDGLLIDIGSTTSDLLVLRRGEVWNLGYSDRERLASDELVYTGVVRTPVMAVTQRVPFHGAWQGVANEHFATMADVYRLLGELPDGADLHPSADGRDKGLPASRRRLARMLGADRDDGSEQDWRALASFIADRQIDVLSRACARQFSRGMAFDAPLVGAGVGGFLVRRLARRMEREYIDFDSLCEPLVEGTLDVSVCAPAVALARLGETQSNSREAVLCVC
jgi:probable H4MPT-linked C1 transfer pathway protein